MDTKSFYDQNPITARLIFQFVVILVLLIVVIMMYVHWGHFTTLSHCMAEQNHIGYFFLLSMAVISLLFFMIYCSRSSTPFLYYLLVPILLIICLLDTYNFHYLHMIFLIVYSLMIFYILVRYRPLWYCLVFLLIPFVALGSLGLAEILFFVLVALLLP